MGDPRQRYSHEGGVVLTMDPMVSGSETKVSKPVPPAIPPASSPLLVPLAEGAIHKNGIVRGQDEAYRMTRSNGTAPSSG